MKEITFEINNNEPSFGSPQHFKHFIASQMQEAAKNGSFLCNIKFTCYDSKYPNIKHSPLKIQIPILEKYPGYTEKESVDAILIYIQNEIKSKYQQLSSMVKPEESKDNVTLNFLRNLGICKDLDLDETMSKKMNNYVDAFGFLVDATQKFNADRKAQKQGVKYEHNIVRYGKHKYDVFIMPYIINQPTKNSISNTFIDDSSHFDFVIYDRIDMANTIKKPVMLDISFLKTTSAKPTQSNTFFSVMVPIIPLNEAGTTKNEQRKIQEAQKDIILKYIRSEIQKNCNYYYESKSYAEIDELIAVLGKLEICQGLDIYDTKRMLTNAYRTISSQKNATQQPGA